MGRRPGFRGFLGQENAYSVGERAVRGDVENELRGWSLGIAGESGAFADKIVLVDVALGAGVGLHVANGHEDIMHSQKNEPHRAQTNPGEAGGLICSRSRGSTRVRTPMLDSARRTQKNGRGVLYLRLAF